jgi:hypothetical protein
MSRAPLPAGEHLEQTTENQERELLAVANRTPAWVGCISFCSFPWNAWRWQAPGTATRGIA